MKFNEIGCHIAVHGVSSLNWRRGVAVCHQQCRVTPKPTAGLGVLGILGSLLESRAAETLRGPNTLLYTEFGSSPKFKRFQRNYSLTVFMTKCPGSARDPKSGGVIASVILGVITGIGVIIFFVVDVYDLECHEECKTSENPGSPCSVCENLDIVRENLIRGWVLKIGSILWIVAAFACGCFKEVFTCPKCPQDCNFRYFCYGRVCWLLGASILLVVGVPVVPHLIVVDPMDYAGTRSFGAAVLVFILFAIGMCLVSCCCIIARMCVPELIENRADEENQSLIPSRQAQVPTWLVSPWPFFRHQR